MRCGPIGKSLMVVVLALGFFLQTVLVYTDTKSSVQLDALGVVGRGLWMQNNCQACHQIYGFGGFLGPDLTNAASRLERDQLEAQLALGQGQMPRIEMDADEVDALWTFLVAVDQTGIGQARHPDLVKVANFAQAKTNPQSKAIASTIAQSGDALVDAGFTLFQSSTCLACHVYFSASSVGAPDLSISVGTLGTDELMDVLEYGRLPKMPPAGFSLTQRAQVVAFLEFLTKEREAIRSQIEGKPNTFWTTLPWWEYE